MKFVLDEHFSPAIAEQLQLRGYDVIPIAERIDAARAHLRGWPDEDVLRWARDNARVVVTENVRDFIHLHHAFLARDETHAGILLMPSSKFPRHVAATGLLVNALASFIDEHDSCTLAGDVARL